VRQAVPRTATCEARAAGHVVAMAEEQTFRKGDDVEWSSHGNTVEGTVEKKITEDTKAAGRTVKADKDDPQYLVKSDKTGKEAVHKPDALDKA
jgi:hypothetical protein